MRTTIDSGGRVVIPKELRDRLGLGPGQTVEVTEHDGRVEVSPVPTAMHLDQSTGVVIADREMPALTTELVRSTLEQIRR